MAIDKTKELVTNVELINDRLHFSGSVEGNAPVSIDYIPPMGDNMGYTSLELLLLSLSTCLGSALLVFLRRMQKNVSGFSILAKGVRRGDHPTGFKSILMTIQMTSSDVTQADLIQLTGLAEEKYCPVWAMLKGNVAIEMEYIIRNS